MILGVGLSAQGFGLRGPLGILDFGSLGGYGMAGGSLKESPIKGYLFVRGALQRAGRVIL